MKFRKVSFIFMISIFIICILVSPLVYIGLVYKTKYKDLIIYNLKQIEINNSNLNVSMVLSVIKAESNFNEHAKSNSDAYGLMQLQLPTAIEMAKKLNLEVNLEDLYNPEINIKLGINYLNYLFQIFEDKQLVLMSYNAGLNKVKGWQENNELTLENGIYVTPYNETTNYIKKVLKNEKIYKLMRIK